MPQVISKGNEQQQGQAVVLPSLAYSVWKKASIAPDELTLWGGYFDFWSKKIHGPFVKNEVCFLLERLRDPRRRPGSRSSDSSPVLSPDLRTQREVGRHDDQERRRRLSPVRPEAALRQIHRKNQDQSTSTILHCPGKSLWWGLSWIV